MCSTLVELSVRAYSEALRAGLYDLSEAIPLDILAYLLSYNASNGLLDDSMLGVSQTLVVLLAHRSSFSGSTKN